jgi:hypothetical protein
VRVPNPQERFVVILVHDVGRRSVQSPSDAVPRQQLSPPDPAGDPLDELLDRVAVARVRLLDLDDMRI